MARTADTPPSPVAGNESGAHPCKNCGHLVREHFNYCRNCRQRNQPGHPTLWEFLNDFVESIFNVDNRVFRTIPAIFIPGRLPNNFNRGQRVRYVNPLRLFIITAVILLALINWQVGEEIEEGARESLAQEQSTGYRSAFMQELLLNRDTIARVYPAAAPALDSLTDKMGSAKPDSSYFAYYTFDSATVGATSLTVATIDMVKLPVSELLDKYEITGYWERLQLQQEVKIRLQAGSAARVIMGQMVWAVLLVVPFIALLLKILYVRHRRYYVEHFVFTLYVHSFTFSVFILALLADTWLDDGLSYAYAAGAITLFLYLSLGKVYPQHWFKTLVKFLVIGTVYQFVLLFTFLLVLIVAVALF